MAKTSTLDQVFGSLKTDGSPLTAVHIAELTGLDITTVRKKLAILRESGQANLEVAADGTRWYSYVPVDKKADPPAPVDVPPAAEPVAVDAAVYYVRDKNRSLKPQKPMLHKKSRPDATRTRCGLEDTAAYIRPATAEEVDAINPCPVCFKRISTPLSQPKLVPLVAGPEGKQYRQPTLPTILQDI